MTDYTSGNISYVTLPTSTSATGAEPNQNQQQNPASSASVPASAPHLANNVNQNNIDITNPFANAINNRQESGIPADKQSQANNGANGSAGSTSSAAVSFDDIVNKKQFGSLAKELFDQVAEGNVDEFNKSFQSALRGVYKTAVEDANKLLDARIQKLETSLLQKFNNRTEADAIIKDMKSKIPYADNPATEPVARMVLGAYLKQGLNKQEAIAATNQYFNRFADEVSNANVHKSPSLGKSGRDSWDELFNLD